MGNTSAESNAGPMARGVLRATVRFYTSREGGRSAPIASGYRAMLNFQPEQNREFNDGELVLVDREQVEPGDECEVLVRLGNWEAVPVPLERGRPFLLNEGARIIGKGTVVEPPARD